MITRNQCKKYREILETATYNQAIITMLQIHNRVCVTLRNAIHAGKYNELVIDTPTEIKDLWEDALMNVDYNTNDRYDINGESELMKIGIELAASELAIIGFSIGDAREFLQYDNTLSIRLW